jgi:hypothetical protein
MSNREGSGHARPTIKSTAVHVVRAHGLAHHARARFAPRPPVASPIASATSSARRATPMSATTLATAHLGIEENEYDKPTYLRRAMAGDSMSLPGDRKA